VHVDVELAGRGGEEQHRDRVAAAHEQRLVAVEHRAQQQPVAHPAACRRLARPRLEAHERPYQPRRRERLARRTEERRQRETARGRIAADHRPGPLRAQHLCQALAQPAHGGIGDHLPPVVLEPESRAGTRHREACQQVDHVPHLGAGRAEELAPRRGGGEQVAHLHERTRRSAGGSGRPRTAAVRLDRDRGRVVCPARHQPHRPRRGDARQRLAAEAEGRHALELVERRELARPVPRECQQGVVGVHALAVVAHRDAVDAAAAQADLDVARAGVERVLHQLLHHRRGTLDHLAGGDLSLYDRGEYGDLPHATRIRLRG
jgi:hypothetical protein